MIRGKMAIMIDPRKMMPGNQPQDIQAVIRAKKQQENGEEPEGDAAISLPIINTPSNMGSGNFQHDFSENKTDEPTSPTGNETGEAGDGAENPDPESGGLKHVKRAKVTGRKHKKIPVFIQDTSEKRVMVLSEIRRSEQLYVTVLDSFVFVFIRPILADPAAYKMSPAQASQLCSQIKQISTFAAEFQESPAFANGDDIAESFIQSIDKLTQVYNSYIEKFIPDVLQNFHALRSNARFSAFIRQVQERNGILVLDSFLIPLQRMAVYELLLRKQGQNYPEGSPEAMKINRAIELIRESSEACSSIREQAEESAKVLSEQLSLARNGRDISLWTPERRLIRKMVLSKGKRKDNMSESAQMETRGENQRMVLLFTDLLLWATELPDGAYKGHLFLTEASFSALDEGAMPSIIVSVLHEDDKKKKKNHSTSVSDADAGKKYSKGDGWLLTFGDIKDRDSWLQDIHRLQKELEALPEDTSLMVPLNIRSEKAKSCCTVM